MIDVQKEYERIIKEVKKTRKFHPGTLNIAFELAKEAHSGQLRKSNEPYIIHPLKVMEILANLGFESNILAAALLHDVVEDNTKYNYEIIKEKTNGEVADIVDAVTSIKKELHPNLTKNEVDILSFKKLFNSAQKNKYAFYIKFADRIHNMQTINVMNYENQIKKVDETEKVLLPIARELKANYFISELESLCFSIRNPELHHSINELINKRKINSYFSRSNYELLIEAFFRNKFSNEVLEVRELFINAYHRDLNPYEVYKCLPKTVDQPITLPTDLSTYENIPLLSSYIITEDDDYPLKDFYRLYKEFLFTKGYVWQGFYQKEGCSTIFLTDSFENLFQINVVDQVNYAEFLIGSSEGVSLLKIESELEEVFVKKILVYKKDGESIEIEEGSTVLDFAFEIHEEVGLCARYGIINDKKVDLNTVLKPGDRVNVKSSTMKDEYTNYQAQIKWFLFVNTKKAKRQLVKFFESNHN